MTVISQAGFNLGSGCARSLRRRSAARVEQGDLFEFCGHWHPDLPLLTGKPQRNGLAGQRLDNSHVAQVACRAELRVTQAGRLSEHGRLSCNGS